MAMGGRTDFRLAESIPATARALRKACGHSLESLLPKEIPQLPGFEVASAWRPARAVGWDYFDVLKLGENRLAICIADVSGKGVPAALHGQRAGQSARIGSRPG